MALSALLSSTLCLLKADGAVIKHETNWGGVTVSTFHDISGKDYESFLAPVIFYHQ